MDINLKIISGRLTSDPKEISTSTGTTFATFSIANNYWNGSESCAQFFDVKCFGKTADTIIKHVKKGQDVTVEGQSRVETWEHEGQKRSKEVTIARVIKFQFQKNSEQDSGTEQSQNGVTEEPQKSFTDDDIPF